MTINDVLNYNKAIMTIIDNINNMPALVKFKMLGMCKQFEPIVSNFDSIRQDKIRQYSNNKEDGSLGIIMPNKDDFENDDEYTKAVAEYEDCIKKFTDDIKELLNSEADITVKKFKVDEIMNVGIPSEYLISIYDLMEE